ncbi:MAG: hypothetical protein GF334_13620 [Candidatus Altiarchaeales archaeon]|nr:hypothetical protein [Candidatus Altiarchaeales archaeon]
MLASVIIFFALMILFLSSLEDLKTGEIPEKYSHTLISGVILFSAAYSLYELSPQPFLSALFFLVLFFLISCALFYTGQWGGGDVKLATGVGALLGLLDEMAYPWVNMVFFETPIPASMVYWVDMAVLSVPYVTVYSLLLGLASPTIRGKITSKLCKPPVLVILLTSLIIPSIALLYFGFSAFIKLYFLIIFFVLLTFYLKFIEYAALRKKIRVSKLQEGDIVATDVLVGGRKIASSRNIEGLDEKQINLIRQAAESGQLGDVIEIKWGVKFAPVLFFALIGVLFYGNLLEVIIGFFFGF